MKFIPLITLIISFCSIFVYAGQKQFQTGKIIVAVEALRNDSGAVRISLYNSKEGFPTKPEKALQTIVTDIEKGRARATFEDISYSEYAAAVLHDENGNGKMDFRWLMLPAEGFGASNILEKRTIPPAFKDAKFVLNSEEIKMKIRIHY